MNHTRFLLLFIFFIPAFTQAQDLENDLKSWYLQDPTAGKFNGIALEKMYNQLKGKASSKTIVAVLDSGIDIEHEDLRDVIWINRDEIPGNGIDDDKNGYVDDIYGWNFIGGKDNSQVAYDNYEITRLYRMQKKHFAEMDPAKLKGKKKKAYEEFKEMEEKVLKERESAEKQFNEIEQMETVIGNSLRSLKEALGDTEFTKENVEKLDDNGDVRLNIAKQIAAQIFSFSPVEMTIDDAIEEVNEQFVDQREYYEVKYKYGYNVEYDPREIIGDNYFDPHEKNYGNNQVEGPDPFHGTHVAGIIGANRRNEIGINGIADNVEIMVLRVVPDGDERDKDVANAIRYAVDNGATVINMSFGKGQSPFKHVVDAAIKYAEKKDVLLVHAAGNSAGDNDLGNNFPTDIYDKKGLFGRKRAKNWIEVGALSWQKGEDMIASFSNYGKQQVDIFAPGVYTYSTNPDDTYKEADGTSFAAPVVSGVASVLRSYFPGLSAVQVKSIIMESAVTPGISVKHPATGELVPISDLAVVGGFINGSKAVQLAKQTKPKYKVTIQPPRT